MSTTDTQMIQEDEIDLKELFGTIAKNRYKIVLFTFVATLLSVIYTLSLPNSYTSSTILTLQTKSKSSLSGLGALAGMAGIDIGGSGSGVDPSVSMQMILNDYTFQAYMIEKYDLVNRLQTPKENLVFALGYSGIFDLFRSSVDVKDEERDIKEEIFNAYKNLTKIISLQTDQKSGVITLQAEYHDRFLAKEIVEIYLLELTSHLRTIEMQDVQKQIDYYNNELRNTLELSLKEQLSGIISGLVQKKVLSLASEFYNVAQLTKPQVAYVKDKTKPKRALIVVVSFVTSFILAIFIVFFREFLSSQKSENDDN